MGGYVSGAADASDLARASAVADSLLTLDTAQQTVTYHPEFYTCLFESIVFLSRCTASLLARPDCSFIKGGETRESWLTLEATYL
jgi:hypothetical protein